MQYLIFERYDESLKLLDSLTHHARFTDKEAQALQWIIESTETTKDQTAQAAAIRLFVLQTLHANNRWHPVARKKERSFLQHYEPVLNLYFAQVSNLPHRYQFHYSLFDLAVPYRPSPFIEFDMLRSLAHAYERDGVYNPALYERVAAFCGLVTENMQSVADDLKKLDSGRAEQASAEGRHAGYPLDPGDCRKVDSGFESERAAHMGCDQKLQRRFLRNALHGVPAAI